MVMRDRQFVWVSLMTGRHKLNAHPIELLQELLKVGHQLSVAVLADERLGYSQDKRTICVFDIVPFFPDTNSSKQYK